MIARANLLSQIEGLSVLVVGETMLDRYVSGPAGRLAPEAPAPVVDVTSDHAYPGGAANVAANAASLGARVTLVTALGDDAAGCQVRTLLAESGVHLAAAHEPGRQTLTKTRVIADGTLLARIDTGSKGPVSASAQHSMIEAISTAWAAADAVIVSDYGYGVLTGAVRACLATCQRDQPRLTAVDAKDLAPYAALRPTLVKPNFKQAMAMAGVPAHAGSGEPRAARVSTSLHRLRAATGASVLAITIDADGALVATPDGAVHKTPAPHAADGLRTVGAGDTYLTAFALALAAGASTTDAAELAADAAAAVVREVGTLVCAPADLARSMPACLLPLDEAIALRRSVRERGGRFVLAGGVFDILHPGHVAFLQRARQLGDVLMVAVNGDESVRRLKGPTRPVNGLADRAAVLAGLGCVDAVVAFDEDTPVAVIEQLQPDVFAKGGDYTASDLPETPVVERLGGSVVILDYEPDRSTTRVIERIAWSLEDRLKEPA